MKNEFNKLRLKKVKWASMAEHAVPFAPQPQQLATSKQVCLRGSTARLYFMKGDKNNDHHATSDFCSAFQSFLDL